MTRLRPFTLDQFTPYGIGFDSFFEDARRLTDQALSYPPYNIAKNGDSYRLEMAVAGVTYDDLNISLAENVLTISHEPVNETEDTTWTYVHKGVAQRKFSRSLKLNNEIEIKGARLENGMLYIDMERVIPEEKKPRVIQIEQQS
jgi:molecular chaperone IbpA